MLITEIAYHDAFLYFITAISVVIIGCGIGIWLNNQNKPDYIWISIVIFSIMFGISVTIVSAVYEQEYHTQVEQQIESLDCEDLQEAYQMYGREYIKEKYVFECTDNPKEWWER